MKSSSLFIVKNHFIQIRFRSACLRRLHWAVSVWLFSVSFLYSAYNPSYPRTAAFVWGISNYEYYAKFDLILCSVNSPSVAQGLKAINPAIKIVPARDINGGAGMTLPDDWKTRTSTGGGAVFCNLYFPGDFFANMTDFCPRLPLYGNQRYNEYVDDQFMQVIDLNYFDGFGTDGLWTTYYGGAPCNGDIDLDYNGLNDRVETGKGSGWVEVQIQTGALKIIANLRLALDNFGPDKLLIINSGGPHEFGRENTNGFVYEHFSGCYSFIGEKSRFDEWFAKSAQPSTAILNSNFSDSSPKPFRNDLQLMRYTMTLGCLTGVYTEYEDQESHNWKKYYDEYEIDLGLPTGSAQKISNEVWVRFFENGMVLINGNDNKVDVTVGVDQVKVLPGYNPGPDGSYHCIKGNQDLAVNGANALNNGLPFDAGHPITLTVRQAYGLNQNGVLIPVIGDGIILLRIPQAVVADIVVENWNSGTSPGAISPSENRTQLLSGFSQERSCNAGSNYYNLTCRVDNNFDPNTGPPDEPYQSPPFATAPGGSNAQAVFVPNIGVAGQYTVYEWHGSLNGGGLAANVRYLVNHAAGTDTVIVDQSRNTGQWNYLGFYMFTNGQANNVTISAAGASGTVMADAVKFVYQGGPSEDKNPPQLISVSALSADSIRIVFSEPLQKASAENPLNYVVDQSIGNPAACFFNGVNEVGLKLGKLLTKNQNYQLTVTGVADLAGNAMPATSRSFVFQVNFIEDIWVASGKAYSAAVVKEGDKAFNDRDYLVKTISANSSGATWVMTAMDDKAGMQNPFLTYRVTENATVWTGFSTASSLPAWPATEGWKPTGEKVVINIQGTDFDFVLYEKNFAANSTVSLGGNEDTQNRHMYIILNKPAALQDIVGPNGFGVRSADGLLSGFPNPFKGQVEIYYRIPALNHPVPVHLSVYNIHGQEVRRLVQQQIGGGTYSASWDGKNNESKTLQAGLYLVRLDYGRQSVQQKILLLK